MTIWNAGNPYESGSLETRIILRIMSADKADLRFVEVKKKLEYSGDISTWFWVQTLP